MIRELIQKYFSSPKPLEYNLWTSTKKDWNDPFWNGELTQEEINAISNVSHKDMEEMPKYIKNLVEKAFDPALTHRGGIRCYA